MRASHSKTRTGCVTCKARHIRCDREVPGCGQCSSTHRSCPGYSAPMPIRRPKRDHRFAFVAVHPEQTPRPSTRILQLPESNAEPELAYFVHTVVPEISQYDVFRADWLHQVAAACVEDATLRQCCIGFAAMYRARKQYHERHTSAEHAMIAGIPHYSAALAALRRSLADEEAGVAATGPREAAIMSPMLVMAYAVCTMASFLTGRQSDALTHLRLLDRIDMSAFSHGPASHDTVDVLASFDFSNMLYGQPTENHLHNARVLQTLPIVDRMQNGNGTVEFLRARCQALCRQTLAFVRSNENAWFASEAEQSNALGETRKALSQCQAEIRTLMLSRQGAAHKVYRRQLHLLLAMLQLAEILLDRNPLATDALDACHVAAYQSVLENVRRYLPKPTIHSHPLRLMSVDTSVISTLTIVGIYCPSEEIRDQVISLLYLVPQVECLWDARISQRLIRHLSLQEKHSGNATLQVMMEQHGLESFSLTIYDKAGNASVELSLQGISEEPD